MSDRKTGGLKDIDRESEGMDYLTSLSEQIDKIYFKNKLFPGRHPICLSCYTYLILG